MTSSQVDSNEWDPGAGQQYVSRSFGFSYDTANGTYTRTGPDDDVKTFVQVDVANRVSFFRRGPDTDPVMTGNYAYFANGLIQSVTYGNGNNASSTSYTYDDANRLVAIEHLDGATTLLQLDYTYTPNSLPDTITEYDAGGLVAAVEFEYDAHGRLIYERREDYVDDNRDYDLTYEYDQGGNRTKKIDAVNQHEIVYHYDLENPGLYQSSNNRLEYYETFDAVPDPPVVVSTTWYYYNFAGNVTRVVTKAGAPTQYSATRFEYAKNGETVTFVLGETWTWDGQPGCEESLSYDIAFAREFRHDSGRQRYLNRELDPENLEGGVYTVLSETWSDYDGNNIYGDFSIDAAGLATDLRSFEPGVANVNPWVGAGDVDTTYLHSNHLGTLRETTGASAPGLRVFTAFGEPIPITPQDDRYGYVGALGYQNDSEFSFLHVGARYYDPSTGRFLQRDPIGILGGPNVYDYVNGIPTTMVDPTGLHGKTGGRWGHTPGPAGPWCPQCKRDIYQGLKRLPRDVRNATKSLAHSVILACAVAATVIKQMKDRFLGAPIGGPDGNGAPATIGPPPRPAPRPAPPHSQPNPNGSWDAPNDPVAGAFG